MFLVYSKNFRQKNPKYVLYNVINLRLLSSSEDVSCGFQSNSSFKSALSGHNIFLSLRSIFYFHNAAIITSAPFVKGY